MKVRTMNVSITPELGDFVREQVQSGRYTTASEVVREGIRLLQERKSLGEKGKKANRIRGGLGPKRRQ
jgi:putative addiction module CopG family antidote